MSTPLVKTLVNLQDTSAASREIVINSLTQLRALVAEYRELRKSEAESRSEASRQALVEQERDLAKLLLFQAARLGVEWPVNKDDHFVEYARGVFVTMIYFFSKMTGIDVEGFDVDES